MSNLLADADVPPRVLSPADPFAAAAARRSQIDRRLRRNARRKLQLRVAKDATLAVFISAAAFVVLQIAAYHVR